MVKSKRDLFCRQSWTVSEEDVIVIFRPALSLFFPTKAACMRLENGPTREGSNVLHLNFGTKVFLPILWSPKLSCSSFCHVRNREWRADLQYSRKWFKTQYKSKTGQVLSDLGGRVMHNKVGQSRFHVALMQHKHGNRALCFLRATWTEMDTIVNINAVVESNPLY